MSEKPFTGERMSFSRWVWLEEKPLTEMIFCLNLSQNGFFILVDGSEEEGYQFITIDMETLEEIKVPITFLLCHLVYLYAHEEPNREELLRAVEEKRKPIALPE